MLGGLVLAGRHGRLSGLAALGLVGGHALGVGREVAGVTGLLVGVEGAHAPQGAVDVGSRPEAARRQLGDPAIGIGLGLQRLPGHVRAGEPRRVLYRHVVGGAISEGRDMGEGRQCLAYREIAQGGHVVAAGLLQHRQQLAVTQPQPQVGLALNRIELQMVRRDLGQHADGGLIEGVLEAEAIQGDRGCHA